MNFSAIIMLIIGVLLIYGGLIFFIAKALRH
ncbi:MAG: MetS family NSS transporter small subunit [Candidatus Hydrothermae bacterium]|nr:MetS family NSS transporter small subunit [Candidatus Hydrothermae bacterium]